MTGEADRTKKGAAENVVGWGRFPSPGSRAALALGCVCPDEVNFQGAGNPQLSSNMGQRWVYEIDCKLHQIEATTPVSGVEGEPRWLILVDTEEELKK